MAARRSTPRDYSRARPFLQDGPRLGNQYTEDSALRSLLERLVPTPVLHRMEGDFERMGARAVTDIWELGKSAERNEPTLEQFDAWGRRVDHIETSAAWDGLKRIAAEEGLVAAAYERKYGEYSRIYQFVLVYLFHPSSAVFTCPLAMTDGAARVAEITGDPALADAFRHLTSRDPATFWTSGQWMTERPGGSFVGDSETVAKPCGGKAFALHGYKWFSSATTSEMALALARELDEHGCGIPGNRGLSAFYVPVRQADGALNGIRVVRLKKKLGTRALPTAELELDGTRVQRIGAPGRGIPTIAVQFNITRIWNSVCAVSFQRRMLAVARDYASRRRAFGRELSEHPLHLRTLAQLEVEVRGNVHFLFDVIRLQGLVECSHASRADLQLRRLLIPVLKLYTGKRVIDVSNEALECLGGVGYMERSHVPTMLRDARVLAIWEGTTNVLALDMLRAMRKDGCFDTLLAAVHDNVHTDVAELQHDRALVLDACASLLALVADTVGAGTEAQQATARDVAFSIAHVYVASLLVQHAAHTHARTDVLAAHAWCCERALVVRREAVDAETRAADAVLAMDRDEHDHSRGTRMMDAQHPRPRL